MVADGGGLRVVPSRSTAIGSDGSAGARELCVTTWARAPALEVLGVLLAQSCTEESLRGCEFVIGR
jgi:hypothetical protein